jgi:hypothetical protein
MNQLTNFPPQLAADIHDRGLSAEPKIFDEVARLAIFSCLTQLFMIQIS